MLFLPFAILAQDRYHHPPEEVVQSFHKDYPNASKAHWVKTHGQWSANFNDEGEQGYGEMIAHYDGHGRHIGSYIPYDRKDVPQPVLDRVENKYHGGHSYEFTRVESDGDHGYFEVRMHYRGKNKTIYLDEEGNEHDYHHRY